MNVFAVFAVVVLALVAAGTLAVAPWLYAGLAGIAATQIFAKYPTHSAYQKLLRK